MSAFRDLLIWQKSMTLTTKIYNSTKKFPKEEQFGITSQIRRSAVSIQVILQKDLEEIVIKNIYDF
jgi:four helix bundle protein